MKENKVYVIQEIAGSQAGSQTRRLPTVKQDPPFIALCPPQKTPEAPSTPANRAPSGAAEWTPRRP